MYLRDLSCGPSLNLLRARVLPHLRDQAQEIPFRGASSAGPAVRDTLLTARPAPAGA
ncbi:hypothetical protein ABEB22_17405 (plasmid) [Thioclava sp. 'Guangxiensis']|uniref:hypothetical protein n=1 Tax=Thioclava sp. 'Guangxiensis' TaxID=3149044 RepID=UPI003877E91D